MGRDMGRNEANMTGSEGRSPLACFLSERCFSAVYLRRLVAQWIGVRRAAAWRAIRVWQGDWTHGKVLVCGALGRIVVVALPWNDEHAPVCRLGLQKTHRRT